MRTNDYTINGVSENETGVVHTLLYFDIFQYPLTVEEIIKFHPEKCNEDEIKKAIVHLCQDYVIFKHDQFYSLHADSISIERRKSGNMLAKKRLVTAKRYSRLISKFPFVRGILLSGSLSKNYMDSTSDIDYFLITTPGRVWLTRGLLAIFKRIFLFNSRKYFCTNYFIDSETLEIEEKNFYTATETTTLISVYGKELCEKFKAQNSWTRQYFPNMVPQQTAYISEALSYSKTFFERIFSGSLGEKLDLFFMKAARRRWKKKFGTLFSEEDFALAFKSGRNVSKNHPRFFQKKILNLFKDKIEQFEVFNKIKRSA